MDNQFNMYFRGQGLTDLPKNKRRNVTVSGVIKENTLNFGMAVCNPKDQFVKRKGRISAAGKANSNHPALQITIPNGTSKKEIGSFFVKTAKELYNSFLND